MFAYVYPGLFVCYLSLRLPMFNCFLMFTYVYSCLRMFTVFACACLLIYLPMLIHVYLFLHLFTHFNTVYSCLLIFTMFTRVYLCLLVFTYVYRCLLVLVYLCWPVSTCVYLCLHLFTYVYPCLPMFTRVYLCLPLFPRACLHMFTRMWNSRRKSTFRRRNTKKSYLYHVALTLLYLLVLVALQSVLLFPSYKGKRVDH